MTAAFIDTNILVRNLVGDPPGMAQRATAFLAAAQELFLPDLVLAEVVYVLESFYDTTRAQVAELARSILAFPAIVVIDPVLLLRAVEVYELDRLDFADAYLVACAETSGVGVVASFGRAIDRAPSV